MTYSIRNQRQNGFSRRDVYLLKELCLLQHFDELPANLLDQMNNSPGKCSSLVKDKYLTCFLLQLKLVLARFCCLFLNYKRSTVNRLSRCCSVLYQPRWPYLCRLWNNDEDIFLFWYIWHTFFAYYFNTTDDEHMRWHLTWLETYCIFNNFKCVIASNSE